MYPLLAMFRVLHGLAIQQGVVTMSAATTVIAAKSSAKILLPSTAR